MLKAFLAVCVLVGGLILFLNLNTQKVLTAEGMARYTEDELEFECSQGVDVVLRLWIRAKTLVDGTISCFLIRDWKDARKRPIANNTRRYKLEYRQDGGREPTMVGTYTSAGNPAAGDSWYPLKLTARAAGSGGLAVHFDNDATRILRFRPSTRHRKPYS